MASILRTLSAVVVGMTVFLATEEGHAQDKGIGVGDKTREGRNWALVIGINDYAHAPLRYGVKDATLLAETLRNQCGYAEERVHLMADGLEDLKDVPTRTNILDKVRLIADLPRKQDTLLVYFSGHGVSIDDRGYLVPIDAQQMQSGQLVSIAELRQILRVSKAARRVMILDACHSGGEKSGAESVMTKSFENAIKADSEGIVTLASCRSGEISLEGPWPYQGLFTHWLVRGLSGLADREEAGNKDNRVEITELYRYVYERVRAEAAKQRSHQQNPLLLAAQSDQINLARVSGDTSSAKPKGLTLDLGGGMKMELVLIPAGSFRMGSPEGEKYRDDDEGPQHRVRISKPFYMGKHEVTNAQFRRFRKGHDSGAYEGRSLNGDSQPAVEVSWEDAKAFCEWLSGRSDYSVRLPSESEWEYVARSGDGRLFPWGNQWPPSVGSGNYADQTSRRSFPDWEVIDSHRDDHAATAPVGSFAANAFGVHGLAGNVWEWCEDVWHYDYKGAPTDGSAWTIGEELSLRVLRGGAWNGSNRGGLRCADRRWNDADSRNDGSGFRVVVSSIPGT